MDTNMTFRMDSEIKSQMNAICAQLGMTASTAFNIFANAFVREKGMPFSVTIREPETQCRMKRCSMTPIGCFPNSLPIIGEWQNDLDWGG